MRVLICDICQATMKDNEHPFALGVGTDHPQFTKKVESTWTTGEETSASLSHPFIRPFKFVQHWEMCAACGVAFMKVMERATLQGRKEMDEFKKLMS